MGCILWSMEIRQNHQMSARQSSLVRHSQRGPMCKEASVKWSCQGRQLTAESVACWSLSAQTVCDAAARRRFRQTNFKCSEILSTKLTQCSRTKFLVFPSFVIFILFSIAFVGRRFTVYLLADE